MRSKSKKMFSAKAKAWRFRHLLALFTLFSSTQLTNASCENLVAFSPKEFKAFPIVEITNISHNTKKFRIELPSQEHGTVCIFRLILSLNF
jgi:hypothetical protein